MPRILRFRTSENGEVCTYNFDTQLCHIEGEELTEAGGQHRPEFILEQLAVGRWILLSDSDDPQWGDYNTPLTVTSPPPNPRYTWSDVVLEAAVETPMDIESILNDNSQF